MTDARVDRLRQRARDLGNWLVLDYPGGGSEWDLRQNRGERGFVADLDGIEAELTRREVIRQAQGSQDPS